MSTAAASTPYPGRARAQRVPTGSTTIGGSRSAGPQPARPGVQVRRGSRPVRPGSSALADRSGPFDQRGDTVLDVAAAPGCLSMQQRKVGPTGTIVGIDASEQMLQLAAARVVEHGWATSA